MQSCLRAMFQTKAKCNYFNLLFSMTEGGLFYDVLT